MYYKTTAFTVYRSKLANMLSDAVARNIFWYEKCEKILHQ